METKYSATEIAEFEAMIRSRGASLSERLNAIIEHYKNINADDKRRSQIRYSPEWIPKILSGEKTMTIRRTQYPCGVYDVVGESEPDTVVCRIEIVKVEKWETENVLSEYKKIFEVHGDGFDIVAKSGFNYLTDFIQYHRENYASLKYAHEFVLLKGEANV